MRFHHVAISVADFDKSVEFYCAHFGFKVRKRFDKEGRKAVALQRSDVHLEIWCFEGARKGVDDAFDFQTIGCKHIAFTVDDLDAEYTRLKNAGLQITEPKVGSLARYCFITDPDGFAIEILTYLPESGMDE